MLDDDNLTYKKSMVGDAVAKQAERAMITLERSQKLDLLIHLLSNLRQALVVCGPEGIGKTTLLKNLQERRQSQWPICLLQGSSALSFEAVVNELGHFLQLGRANIGFDLSPLRDYCDKHKVVLVIDDAGELVPGLIGELMDFADSLAGLRLVFSMTYDEFHIKSASDRAVDDCHFIELPPLNRKQCGEYLQNLSAQPGAILSFNAVTDGLVESLYRQTNGIPGKILAEIPKLNQYQSRPKSRLGLWLGVAIVLAATGWVVTAFLLPMTGSDATKATQPEKVEPVAVLPTVTPTPAVTPNPTPAPATPAVEESEAVTPAPESAAPTIPESGKTAVTTEDISPTPAAAAATPTPSNPPSPSPSPAEIKAPPAAPTPENNPTEAPMEAAKPTPEPKPVKPIVQGGNLDWIMAQPPGNYTLQIMVLSNKAAADRFLKKYADYSDGLTYYAIDSGGQEKYVLIYGSFKTAAEAQQLKAVMPGEFKQALEKRFRAVQKESRR